jgi:hypothetical protein
MQEGKTNWARIYGAKTRVMTRSRNIVPQSRPKKTRCLHRGTTPDARLKSSGLKPSIPLIPLMESLSGDSSKSARNGRERIAAVTNC